MCCLPLSIKEAMLLKPHCHEYHLPLLIAASLGLLRVSATTLDLWVPLDMGCQEYYRMKVLGLDSPSDGDVEGESEGVGRDDRRDVILLLVDSAHNDRQKLLNSCLQLCVPVGAHCAAGMPNQHTWIRGRNMGSSTYLLTPIKHCQETLRFQHQSRERTTRN